MRIKLDVILATVLTILAINSARAGDWGGTTTCSRSGYGRQSTVSCNTSGHSSYGAPSYGAAPGASVTVVGDGGGKMTEAEANARDRRIADWEDYCRPVGLVDKNGVTRYHYAHDGCEFGAAR